jgi:hypothetical protein
MWVVPRSVVSRCLEVVELGLLDACWGVTVVQVQPHSRLMFRARKEITKETTTFQRPFILSEPWAGGSISFFWYWENSKLLRTRELQFGSASALVFGYLLILPRCWHWGSCSSSFSSHESWRILRESNGNNCTLYKMQNSIQMLGIIFSILVFLILTLKIMNW